MDKTQKVLVIQPTSSEFDLIYRWIRNAINAIAPMAEVQRIDEIPRESGITESIRSAIEDADLVICDISHSNSTVMYELGYIHAIRKPVVIIGRKTDQAPFDLRSIRILLYDFDEGYGAVEFVREMQSMMSEAFKNPSSFSTLPVTQSSIDTIFISYSHKDLKYLKRLLVHLRPLEKQGLIDMWVDTKLKAGDDWQQEIENALKRARVAILLVSADFLGSDFVVDNELPPILSKAESQGTLIIPVIITACRYTRDKNLSKFHCINGVPPI